MYRWRLYLISILIIGVLVGLSAPNFAQPEISSDGIITFQRDGNIYIINPDGSDERLITEGSDPEISPSGDRIAFVRDVEVYVINIDGTNEQQYSYVPTEFAFAPSWSPDEKSLVIWEPNAANAATGQRIQFQNLHRVDLDFFYVEPITQDTDFQQDPDWSPDGSKILYTSSPFGEGNYQIFTMNPDGSDVAQLTDTELSKSGPRWSPDGELIASSDSFEIFVMNADGSEPRSVTSTQFAREFAPTWSPDGTQLAYQTLNQSGDWEIRVINLDGTGTRVLNTGDGNVFNPHWGSECSTRVAERVNDC